jgi:hypothetical protein
MANAFADSRIIDAAVAASNAASAPAQTNASRGTVGAPAVATVYSKKAKNAMDPNFGNPTAHNSTTKAANSNAAIAAPTIPQSAKGISARLKKTNPLRSGTAMSATTINSSNALLPNAPGRRETFLIAERGMRHV